MKQLALAERVAAFQDSSLKIPRAGYPLPDAAWYRNCDPKTGTHIPMTFSKERFVQGFNLTCGEYYILRDHLVKALRKDNIYKKKFNDPNVDYDHLWPIFDDLNRHPLLQNDAHVGWRHHMLFRWVTVTAAWITQLEKKIPDVNTYPFLPAENWKWGRADLSPKKKAPYVLYKHINIRFVGKREEVVIIRVIDLMEKDERPKMGDMTDLNLDRIRFTRLIERLHENTAVEFEDNDKIFFLHASAGNRYVTIGNDRQLAYALQLLRIRGSSKVELRL
ncbi:hypothetical protein HRS9139_04059 [Pyrenophora teres f. teres]|uniref:Uncharacterized protein n=1 Tax=Pyrenophora teres f. teres TaxID=97479 RepID=A0A6S6VGR9_9PLEO|nr:hypothetical protein HRS9139_04059 [Pyrenophora teres f. teres]CAE6998997.1 hypothetical protein PTTW11_00821 [Pyrenophora teres f. teres]